MYPKTGNDYPVGFTRNIINICHQSLRCKQGSSLVSQRLLYVLRMNSPSSTLEFCLSKDLGIYLCLYWDYSMCQRVYPCLLVSDTMDVLPGIVNTLYLSHELRGVLVIPVTGTGELGLYNYWRWPPYLSFRLWLLDIFAILPQIP